MPPGDGVGSRSSRGPSASSASAGATWCRRRAVRAHPPGIRLGEHRPVRDRRRRRGAVHGQRSRRAPPLNPRRRANRRPRPLASPASPSSSAPILVGRSGPFHSPVVGKSSSGPQARRHGEPNALRASVVKPSRQRRSPRTGRGGRSRRRAAMGDRRAHVR